MDKPEPGAAWRRTRRLALTVAAAAAAATSLAASTACGGGGDRGKAATGAAGGGAPPAGAPAAATPSAPSGTLSEADITPQMVALGDSIFKGQAAGGICFTCHGPNAEGTQLAPNLTDQQWIDIDGSLASISRVVHEGVPQPKQHPAPMPPFGSALTEAQIRAVTAYVYSRSHPNVGGGA